MVKRAWLLASLFVFSVTSIPPLARAQSYSVDAGTVIHCRLSQTLSTRVNFTGDPFAAAVSEPVLLNGHVVIPAGATLEGKVVELERPGRIKGVGEMRLTLEKLTLPDGRSFPLNAVLQATYGAEGTRVTGAEGTVKGPSSRLKTIEEVSVLAAGGGLAGLAFGHSIAGIALGGGAGFLDRMRRRGQDLTLPQGTQLDYQLTRELVVPAARLPN